MAILNYTTKINSAKTIAEIQSILGSKGATHVSVEYANGRATAVLFGLKVGIGNVNFKLPCNVQGVSDALRLDKRPTIARDREQCERIAWRIVKDWVEAQMALVEAGQAEIAEVFFPYVIQSNDQTMFQAFKSQALQLAAGEQDIHSKEPK